MEKYLAICFLHQAFLSVATRSDDQSNEVDFRMLFHWNKDFFLRKEKACLTILLFIVEYETIKALAQTIVRTPTSNF